MLKEIRSIKKRSKANYIRNMQYKGYIGAYFSGDGYLAYDTEELKKRQKTHKRGRPSKFLNRENKDVV